MLPKDENEILCRVGPGTAMGNLLRQYWFPAMPSLELAFAGLPADQGAAAGRGPRGVPRHLGTVGLVANSCPHRGASLFFGRNEEDGLRCVYHGWKFDISRRLHRHAVRAGRIELQEQGARRAPTTPATSTT